MKTALVEFSDGRIEQVDEASIDLARALEAAARDPLMGATVKVAVSYIMIAEAARKAGHG